MGIWDRQPLKRSRLYWVHSQSWHFDKDKDHIVQTDASKTGLSAVLLLEGQPIVYASRALTDTECRYSKIERELLGVVFGLKKLHHYTFGKSITVETDHQPPTSIWKKTIETSSPRLQRLLLRLTQYDMHIEYLQDREMSWQMHFPGWHPWSQSHKTATPV